MRNRGVPADRDPKTEYESIVYRSMSIKLVCMDTANSPFRPSFGEAPHQNSVSKTINAKKSNRFYAAFGCRCQLKADSFFIRPVSSLGVYFRAWVFGLCDADDKHHLVVRSDDVSVDPHGVGINRTPAMVVLLVWSPRVIFTFALNHIIVWRTALTMSAIVH